MKPPPSKYGREALAVGGLALFAAGLWWVYPPAALIVVGFLVLAAATWGHFRGG